MANSYFKFKQFTINQDRCAQKVCTDACLFGAVLALENLGNATCLEIGTGTGLLSLMLLQKNDQVNIDTVEIDREAAGQAAENIAATPWAANINLLHVDILKFNPDQQYDFIFSNPPFFENDLQTTDDATNRARHNATLTLSQMLNVAAKRLAPNGRFAVLLPYQRVDHFKEEAGKKGFCLSRQILVKQSLKHKFFRGILFFQRLPQEPDFGELAIKADEQDYTPEFAALLKDYYLYL